VEIRIDPHTLERAEERGTNEAEIEDVVTTGFPILAKCGRHGKGKSLPFGKLRRVDSTNKSEWKCSTLRKRTL
jgi:hypothetical protein